MSFTVDGPIFATLVHLSTNCWYEEDNTVCPCDRVWTSPASPRLRFDRDLFPRYLAELKAAGNNAILLDVGDGIRFDSHPEIAVEDALTPDEARELIALIEGAGMEIIPKLNFSTTHDTWMKDYAKMVSTPLYYQVCADLINEVCQLFKPRFLHLGMDEEVYANQAKYNYVVIRQNELWWHDFLYLVGVTEANGVRAMMWSDMAREHAEELIARCPKSVIQCPWYYFDQFEPPYTYVNEIRVRPFLQLAEAGYDILACGSVEYFDDNLEKLTAYCKRLLPQDRLMGFCQTTWASVTPDWKYLLDKGTFSLKQSREIYERFS